MGFHFLFIHGKDNTVHDFSGTILYCKEESVSGPLKIPFIRWLHLPVIAKDLSGCWISSQSLEQFFSLLLRFGMRQVQKQNICLSRDV